MKKNIACIILIALLGITVSASIAQQNQNVPKTDTEVEKLQRRVSELEGKLQTVENVEKMELAAKLAEAQAKLAEANAKFMNAEFGKFERELRDSNHKWLTGWILFFLAILSAVGAALWSRFKSKTVQLIADRVEERLNGFKEALDQVEAMKNELKQAMGQVNILESQLKVIEKENAISMLEDTFQYTSGSGDAYDLLKENAPTSLQTINEPRDEALLNIFGDPKYDVTVRHWAAVVLADRKSPRLVSPLLERLNSEVDSDSDIDSYLGAFLHAYIKFLGQIPTLEAYHGLEKFLNRLLSELPKHKDLFLGWATYALAEISIELDKGDSVPLLRKAIPDLKNLISSEYKPQCLFTRYFDMFSIARLFDRFNVPEGIKEILTNGLTDGIPEVETRCLELLQKHDPKFVNEWRAQKETANTENEDSS